MEIIILKELKQAHIRFDYNGIEIKFDVFHNLPEIHGLSIENAVIAWTARTDDLTDNSFCEYVKRKDSQTICLTKKQFKKFYSEVEIKVY